MRRTVVQEALLDSAIDSHTIPPARPRPAPLPAPLSWAIGSNACPVCHEVHTAHCPKFWVAYAAFNMALREKLRGVPTPLPPRPPECRSKHPFESTCTTCDWRRTGKGGAL